MKKSLLTISAAMLTAMAASAATPQFVDGCFASGISSNGEWGVNFMGEFISLVNLKTGEQTELDMDGVISPGHCVADNGTIVFSSPGDLPYIYINGECKELDTYELLDCNLVYLHSISPDGTLIVGSFSPKESRGQMGGFPAIWEIDGDGKVIKATELPCPTVDFSGRTPQRCNAYAISDDGKTIVGNLIDYSGFFPQPIVYTLGADGEWTYSLPAESLINPDNLEFPEWPGEMTSPDPKDFMTQEEADAYQQAQDDYWAGEGEWPLATDFMTAEEIADYEAAVNAYNAYIAKVNDYYDVFYQLYESATVFEQNSEMISPDGKTIAASAAKSEVDPLDPWNETIYYYAVTIDLTTGDITESAKGTNVLPNQLLNGGVIIGTDRVSSDGVPQVAFIKDGPDAEFITLVDYYKEVDPELATWMEENLKHTIEIFDWSTWGTTEIEDTFTGLVWMSADQSTLFSGVIAYMWDENNDYVSYVVNGALSGVSNVAVGAKDIRISAQRGGVINIAGDATRVSVYDLAGRMVFTAPAASSVATGLGNGAYIVKVDTANGAKTAKVTF